MARKSLAKLCLSPSGRQSERKTRSRWAGEAPVSRMGRASERMRPRRRMFGEQMKYGKGESSGGSGMGGALGWRAVVSREQKRKAQRGPQEAERAVRTRRARRSSMGVREDEDMVAVELGGGGKERAVLCDVSNVQVYIVFRSEAKERTVCVKRKETARKETTKRSCLARVTIAGCKRMQATSH